MLQEYLGVYIDAFWCPDGGFGGFAAESTLVRGRVVAGGALERLPFVWVRTCLVMFALRSLMYLQLPQAQVKRFFCPDVACSRHGNHCGAPVAQSSADEGAKRQ